MIDCHHTKAGTASLGSAAKRRTVGAQQVAGDVGLSELERDVYKKRSIVMEPTKFGIAVDDLIHEWQVDGSLDTRLRALSV
jgi:hypothetical protein